MFLKKMEIDGFKSFARKITIDFDSPLTAIVGPNGSGKSNIVDAIRWVLGEQSAKTLRGSQMSDVIFAGSDDHQPLSRARVTLYLDNSEGILDLPEAEVRISRRVTQSGESDYLLNGQVCRLKDIQDLLMDTGLGKDTYSIVGQGRITSILNSKPDRLRELFEEAAGISKHKSRKGEAQKRLEATNRDLQRIKDLIHELRGKVEPLSREAEKARKYRRLNQELTDLETGYLLDQWEQLSEELSELKDERTRVRQQVENKQDRLDTVNSELQEEKIDLKELQQQLEQIRDQYYEYKTRREEANNRLNIIEERKRGLTKEQDNFQQQIQELATDSSQLKQHISELSGRIKKVAGNKQEISQKLEDEQEELGDLNQEISRIQQQLQSLRHDTDDGRSLQEKRRELERLRERTGFLSERLEKLASERQELEDRIRETRDKQKQTRCQLEQVNRQKQEHQQQLEELEQEKDRLSRKLKQSRDKYSQFQQSYQEKKSQLNYLKKAESNYNGYYRGVRNILNSEKFSGILGVVADLIEVDRKYVQAIETALGSRQQNIVVESDTTARRAIKFLKKQQKGRATLLPLNMINGRTAGIDRIKELEGFLGLASGLVAYEDRLQPVIEYLLGRTLIANDIDRGTVISRKTETRYKVVTLDGDVINPGGAMTGGSSSSQQQGLIQRATEIETLEQQVNKLQTQMEEKADKGLELKDELEEFNQRQEQLEDKLQQLEIKGRSLEKDKADREQRLQELSREKSSLSGEIEDLKQQNQQATDRCQQLEEEIESLTESYSREQEQIEDREDRLTRLKQQRERIRDRITDLRVELAPIEQQETDLLQEQEDSETELAEHQQKRQELEKRIEEIEKTLDRLQEQKEDLKQKAADYAKRVEELDGERKDLSGRISEKEELVETLETTAGDLQETLEDLRSRLHGLELKITRRENKQEKIQEKLDEEYDIDPESADSLPGNRLKLEDYSQVKQKIKELKHSLKQLGMVNHNAEEEYQDLKSRLDYLQSQQEDLIQARESIERVIEKIERNMISLFEETYYQVKEEFEAVFQELFDGGQAELSLTDPDDMLKTGVEINAQPPGKQLKKLSLLSGGERALSAIALVFAFLRVNPSPFYILDEIDAPLDDANIVRFARFIKKYSRVAQFVIVTHRKHMMSRVETIYGLTMQESGVSELVSLRMDEEMAL